MSSPDAQNEIIYVYRRAAPDQVPAGNTSTDLFLPGKDAIRGLSVYLIEKQTPRNVLQLRIEEWNEGLTDPQTHDRCATKLEQTPDVESMVAAGWRVVLLSLADVQAMGFQWEEDDEVTGHVNIIGSRSDFKAKRLDFQELLNTQRARVLTPDECLAQ